MKIEIKIEDSIVDQVKELFPERDITDLANEAIVYYTKLLKNIKKYDTESSD